MKESNFKVLKYILNNILKPLFLLIISSLIFLVFDWQSFFIFSAIPKNSFSTNCTINYMLLTIIIDIIVKLVSNKNINVYLKISKSKEKSSPKNVENLSIDKKNSYSAYLVYFIDSNLDIDNDYYSDDDYIEIKPDNFLSLTIGEENGFPGENIKIKLKDLYSKYFRVVPINVMMSKKISDTSPVEGYISVGLHVSKRHIFKIRSLRNVDLHVDKKWYFIWKKEFIISTTTRWSVNEYNNLEDLKNLISKSEKNDNETISNLKLNLKSKCETHPFNINLSENNVSFYVYNVEYNTTNADVTRKNENILILYKIENQENPNIIIDKNSGALSLLRIIFGFTGRNEISNVSNEVSSEFIIWLVNLVYNNDDVYSELKLDYVTGLRGDTDDSDNKVSIKGNNTMNILSSLSFLLESSNMNRISIQIEFKNHDDIKLNLGINNTVSVNRYIGPYLDKEYSDLYGEDCEEFLQYLLVYCEILPLMIKWYEENNADEDYGQNGNKLYTTFLEQLADDLSQKISDRKAELKSANDDK